MLLSSTRRQPASILRRARIVEFAAVPLVAGRLDQRSSVRRLVNPGRKNTVEAVRIHGIDDEAVASAADFGSVWPEISASIRDKVLIGHTLDFDLAVLRLECKRIGATFKFGHTLDVRMLAELAEPSLADFSMESLADLARCQDDWPAFCLGRCEYHRKHIYGAWCHACATAA